MGKRLLLGAIVSLSMVAAGAAQATLVGGPVPLTTFGGSIAYNYQGSTVPAFTTNGGGTLQLTVATFGDTFGTAHTDQSGQSVIFTNSTDTAGTTRTIAPGYSPFLFFFKTVGTNQMANCNPSNGSDCAATLFTDGSNAGVAGGNNGGQTNLAIYYSNVTNTYAMFFDDGGPLGLTGSTSNDDNDYNDLVVTYTPNTVPEPFSIGILGSALIGFGITRLRNPRKRTAS